MDYKILRNNTDAIFEPHILPNKELPFIFHLTQTSGNRVSNFHENPELLYFLDGTGTVRYDSTAYPVQQGDLIVVNPYTIHQLSSDRPLKYVCLIIDTSFCRQHNIDITALRFDAKIQSKRFDEGFKRLINEYKAKEPFRETAIKLTVLELLLLLCRDYSCLQPAQQTTNESSQKRVRAAIGYIKSHITKKLTAAEIAASVGVSQYHFMREFKHFTGCTLNNYISIIRCEYAKELLHSRQHKVKEVAFLCGFETEAYFTTFFKKQTGMSPSKYVSSL